MKLLFITVVALLAFSLILGGCGQTTTSPTPTTPTQTTPTTTQPTQTPTQTTPATPTTKPTHDAITYSQRGLW